jgi:hypothetical protein
LPHRDRWGTEPQPTSAHLDRLTAAESHLYQNLVEGTFGPNVRLEQERIGWPAVEAAVTAAVGAEMRHRPELFTTLGGEPSRGRPWVT